MSHQLVRITVDDGGDPKFDPQWCLVDGGNPEGAATLCQGEFFGYGESGCVFEVKYVQRGGITCVRCNDKIRLYKEVRL